MKSMKNIAMLFALAAMSDIGSTPKQKVDLPKQRNIEPPIPKGCSVYYFLSNGTLSETPTQYKVIALNEKSARRKFKNLNLAF